MTPILAGRAAIVTGAGQGIGAAIAHTLAAAGASVAVNDLNPDRAEQVAASITAAGDTAVAIAADVANKFQCVHLIETTRATFGRLDILVNNAAVEPVVPILKMDEWDWTRCLDVNLKGTFFMSQLCGRVMADENGDRGGVIVNMSALAGVAGPAAGRAAFAASKAGVVGFAHECAREYAAYGIRVNTVVVGDFDTPGAAVVRAKLAGADAPSPSALGRAGRPQEAADLVLFLCSDASGYMTGSTLTIDGGQVTR